MFSGEGNCEFLLSFLLVSIICSLSQKMTFRNFEIFIVMGVNHVRVVLHFRVLVLRVSRRSNGYRISIRLGVCLVIMAEFLEYQI